jgi:hypothetical protein
LAPGNSSKILSSANKPLAEHINVLLKDHPTLSRDLRSNPIVAIHALALAHPKDALDCPNFRKFNETVAGPNVPQSLALMMYFSLDTLKVNRSHIWHSDLFVGATQKTASEIDATWRHKVEKFTNDVVQEDLHTEYSKLLSAMTFDHTLVPASVLALGNFSDLQPPKQKIDKQAIQVQINKLNLELMGMQENVRPEKVTPKDLAEMEELKKHLATHTDHLKSSRILHQHAVATALYNSWSTNIMNEEEKRQRIMKAIADKYSGITTLQKTADLQALKKLGRSDAATYTLPHHHSMNSENLRKLLGNMKTVRQNLKVAQLRQ